MHLYLVRQLVLHVLLTWANEQTLPLPAHDHPQSMNTSWSVGVSFFLGNRFFPRQTQLCFHDRAGPWLSRYCLMYQFVHHINGYEIWANLPKENRGKKNPKPNSLILLKNPQFSFLKKDPYFSSDKVFKNTSKSITRSWKCWILSKTILKYSQRYLQ